MNSYKEEVKKFKVLIVEDDSLALLQLEKFFKRIFDEVVTCENGLDGFLTYKDNFDKDRKFDLIISDINMPKLDGLEMLEKIREIDSDIPVVLLTARSEPESLLKAINFHVNAYIIKPIDLDIVNEKIKNISKELYIKKVYEYQQIEIKNYMNILEEESLVIKYDKNGDITFVNDSYHNFSGFKKEELIGVNFKNFKHPSISIKVNDEIWNTLNLGKSWKGKTKQISKFKEDYFLNTKIIPIFDLDKNTIKEFMSINFLSTEEELKHRDKYKHFMQQISKDKRLLSKIREENKHLYSEIEGIKESSKINENQYNGYKQKLRDLNSQIEFYEKSSSEDSKLDMMKEKAKNKQFDIINTSLIKSEQKNKHLLKEVFELKETLQVKENMNIIYKDSEINHLKRIDDLSELVTNLQKEKEELKSKKSLFGLK